MRMTLAAVVVALIGFLNFFAFLGGAIKIGGDAVNGTVIAGHYFVASHGKYTEVSKAVYSYSLWHVRSLVLTVPLTMLSMGYLGLMMKNAVVPKGYKRF